MAGFFLQFLSNAILFFFLFLLFFFQLNIKSFCSQLNVLAFFNLQAYEYMGGEATTVESETTFQVETATAASILLLVAFNAI